MRRIFQEGLVPDGVTSPKVALLYRAGIVIGETMTPKTARAVAQIHAPMRGKELRQWKRVAWRVCAAYLRGLNPKGEPTKTP